MIKCHLRMYLAMREMTQMQLATEADIRQATISALCTGAAKHVPLDVLDKLCAVLNCQPGDLFEFLPDEDEKE